MKGIVFFFFFFPSFFRFQFFGGETLHPSDILKCKFFNVFFPVFKVVQIWLKFFFFKYYICVWSRRNIFIRGGKIFFFIGLFCKFNFWKYRIFFFFFFHYFAIVSFILNLEFWNREDSFFVFLYYHIYLILNEILCDF